MYSYVCVPACVSVLLETKRWETCPCTQVKILRVILRTLKIIHKNLNLSVVSITAFNFCD